MLIETLIQPDVEPVVLSRATLCLDCEIISNSRRDECPTCHGHSLLNLARILGGSLRPHQNGSVMREDA